MEYSYLNKEVILNNIINLSQLTFEVTDACNLKCKYCGYGDLYQGFDERVNKQLPVDRAIRLLEYLMEHWNSSYGFSYQKDTYIGFYGGEPLLNMDFIREIVDWIGKHSIPSRRFVFTMTTNGMLLNRYADFLSEHSFQLLVSLDGDAYSNGYRTDHAGNSSFDRVYKNIRYVREKYPDFFEKNVRFNAVLHDRNSYDGLVAFFQKEFNKIPSVAELNPSGIRPERMGEYLKMKNDKFRNINRSPARETLKETLFMDAPETSILCYYLHWHTGNVYKNYTDLLVNHQMKRWYPTGTCLPFGKKMFLTVNGKILPCERISHDHALGWVDEKEVSIDLEKIVERYNAFYANYIPQCSKCYNNHTCIHCMFYNSNLTGSGKCDNFMSKKEYEVYENDQLRYLAEHPALYRKIMTEVVLR